MTEHIKQIINNNLKKLDFIVKSINVHSNKTEGKNTTYSVSCELIKNCDIVHILYNVETIIDVNNTEIIHTVSIKRYQKNYDMINDDRNNRY